MSQSTDDEKGWNKADTDRSKIDSSTSGRRGVNIEISRAKTIIPAVIKETNEHKLIYRKNLIAESSIIVS